jgi:hypothetical protein
MEQIEINVTKNIEEVEINVQPNVTQVIISENIGSGIQSVQAGANVTVDNTDPQNPIVNVPSIPSGGVQSVTGNIVDNTDPANPTVNFNAGDYDLEDFNNGSSDPFVRESELPEGLDQDNLPIKIDLTLSDLGLTEIGTDAEMNTAIKAYFTANNLTVDQKQIPHIRLFDELPSAEPLLFLEFTSLANFATDAGITDVNDVTEWNTFAYFNETTDFESVEVVGNAVTLRGGTVNQTMTTFSPSFDAFEDWQLVECRLENFTTITQYSISNTFSNPILKIVNSPNIVQFGLIANDSTIERFDSNFLDWATNEAPNDGNIDIGGDGGEDLTLSDTYDVLVNTKNWTTP